MLTEITSAQFGEWQAFAGLRDVPKRAPDRRAPPEARSPAPPGVEIEDEVRGGMKTRTMTASGSDPKAALWIFKAHAAAQERKR